MKAKKKTRRSPRRPTKNNRLLFPGKMSLIVMVGLLVAGAAGVGFFSGNPNPPAPRTTPTSPISSTNTPIPSAVPTVSRLSMQTFTVTATPTLPPFSCTNVVSDTMIVFDSSGSMKGNNKMGKAKLAAQSFVDKVAVNPQSRVGLAIFSNTGELFSPLTTNTSQIKNTINSISPLDKTCIQCGIAIANAEIATNKRPTIKQNAIVLTDGQANMVIGNSEQVNNATAKAATKSEALQGYQQHGITYYTIGFGSVDEDVLRDIATSTGGTAYISPDEGQLESFFSSIAQHICR